MAAVYLAAILLVIPVTQISGDIVKNGIYSDNGGPGMMKAVEIVVQDFGSEVNGKTIHILNTNYQNKVDIAAIKV